MTRHILQDVQVLDITHIVAGPYCTRMLADLGAAVIKIDPPGPSENGGQPRRSSGPAALNVGKRSLILDLKHPDGVRVAREIASRVDVLVQNYRPGALEALGLGYDSLRALNPRLIHATISGFGQNTSFANRGAFGATAHAEAGWLWVQQQAQGGDTPFAPGVTVADIVTGMNACTAIVTALYDRERTGLGQSIDIALMDSQLALLAEAAAPALASTAATPWVPFRHGLQRAKDGYLAINLGAVQNWPRLARAMGRPGIPLPEDRTVAEGMLDAWVAGMTVAGAAEALDSEGAPYGVMKSMPEALDHPYFAEREMIVEVADSANGTLRTIASPLFFSGASSAPTSGVPLAGEHSRAILGEIGYGEAAVSALIESGAVGVAPGQDG